MMEIYYQNNELKKLYLDRNPYWMTSKTDLFDHEWETDSGSDGKNIIISRRKLSNKTITVAIRGTSGQDCLVKKNEFIDQIDLDAENESAGKFYMGDWYLNCWLMATKADGEYVGSNVMTFSVTVLAEKMDWIRETTTIFRSGDNEETGANNLDYNYDYPFDYASGMKGQSLISEAVSGSDFRIIIYGPCANPEILIGGYRYAVSANLDSGEYLVINSVSKKIYKVKINGEIVNQCHLKDTEYYIFQKIPAGRNSVSWSGLFGFDITLYEKRSEPRWI